MYYTFKRSDGYVSAINARSREHAEERLASGTQWTFEITGEYRTWAETMDAMRRASPNGQNETQTKQGMFNAIAKQLWPGHTGNIWEADVSMKLMEIGRYNRAMERAADLCCRAEDMPEGDAVLALLREAMELVQGALRD